MNPALALANQSDEEAIARARVAESPFHQYLKSLQKSTKEEITPNATSEEYST